MANKLNEQARPEEAIEAAISKSEQFFMDYGKKLLTALCVVVVVVGGFFAYKYLYKAPQAEKASAMMFVAQQAFAQDSIALALNGDDLNAGFLDVIEEYGSTDQGNIAHHYAGVCYMKLGEYEKALEQLQAYSNVSGLAAEVVNAQNIGLQGDAYVQLKDYQKALKCYEKAVAASENNFTAPYYLFKLAGVYKQLGDNQKALEAYKTIRNNYAGSMESQNIDKYIGQLEQLQ